MAKKKTETSKKAAAPAKKTSSARKTRVSGKPVPARKKTAPAKKTPSARKPHVSGKPATRKATHSTTTRGAKQHKGMAFVAYLLFFIPLLTGAYKKSSFVKFHTNQGTVLFIAFVAMCIVLTILERILRFLWILWALLWPLIAIVILVLLIIGIIHALGGRMKPLPIFGKFTIIK